MTEKQTEASSMTEQTTQAGQLEGHERTGEMKPDNTRFGTHAEGFTWEGDEASRPEGARTESAPRPEGAHVEGEKTSQVETKASTTTKSSASKPK